MLSEENMSVWPATIGVPRSTSDNVSIAINFGTNVPEAESYSRCIPEVMEPEPRFTSESILRSGSRGIILLAVESQINTLPDAMADRSKSFSRDESISVGIHLEDPS